MTIVQIKANAPTSAGEAPAPGVLEWVPTRRRNAGDVVVLPAPFKVRLVSGAGSVNVHATSTEWVWRVTESLAGLPKVIKYVAVPDVPTVNYNALAEVDPETLDPAVTPEPAWYAYVDGLAATAAQAQAEAVAAATGLDIGTVTSGASASASITGEAPNRRLNLGLPQGPPLTASVVGTVTGPETPGATGPQGPTGVKGDPGGFVLGTVLTTEHLDSVKADGIYRFEGVDFTNLGYPSALIQGYGIVHVFNTNGIVGARTNQIIYPTATGAGGKVFFQRVYAGGLWYPWRTYTSSRTDTTAGRAIYSYDEIASRDQLIYGDSGLRSLALDNGYLGSLLIRRVGYTVYLNGVLRRPPGGSINGTFLTTLPEGFKPSVVAWTFFPVRHSPTANWFTLYRKAYELALEGATGDTDAGECRFEVSWNTVQSWPTVLPGSASGSIPNL